MRSLRQRLPQAGPRNAYSLLVTAPIQTHTQTDNCMYVYIYIHNIYDTCIYIYIYLHAIYVRVCNNGHM